MSPIKFYIYGVPDGFDMLSGTIDDKSYFELFYDTSKKGTELKINRKSNGETVYSYLVYDLISCKGRNGAFFGMSVVFSNCEYCNDVRGLSDLFSGVFQQVILKKGILLSKDNNDVCSFRISKFKEQIGECENIAGILQYNIEKNLSQSIVNYDGSFTRNKEGRILTVPYLLPNESFLQVFKEYVWVSLSSEKKAVSQIGQGKPNLGAVADNNQEEQLSPDYILFLRKKTDPYKTFIIEALKGNCNKSEININLNDVEKYLRVLREFSGRQSSILELTKDYSYIHKELSDRLREAEASEGSNGGTAPLSPTPPKSLTQIWKENLQILFEQCLESKTSKIVVALVLVAVALGIINNLIPDKTDKGDGKEYVSGKDDKKKANDSFSIDSLYWFIDQNAFIDADNYIGQFEKDSVKVRRQLMREHIDTWFTITKNRRPTTNKDSLKALKYDVETNLPEYIKGEYLSQINVMIDELSQPVAIEVSKVAEAKVENKTSEVKLKKVPEPKTQQNKQEKQVSLNPTFRRKTFFNFFQGVFGSIFPVSA